MRTTALLILAVAAAGAAAAAEDPRTVELLRHDCTSRISASELTLFANGTLRLRETRPDGESEMRLAEIGRGELAAYLARLREEQLGEVDVRGSEASGDWVERCTLELALEDRPSHRFEFGRMDSLPLALGRLLRIVDDLRLEVENRTPRSRLPAEYEPRRGDVLRRVDGKLFEVVATTGDGAGLELEAVDRSLVIFVPLAALRDEFEELVERLP